MIITQGGGVQQLAAEGVSPWLDGLSQEVIASGQLARLVKDTALRGVTSNMDMFGTALANDWHYRDRLASLTKLDIPVELALRSLSTYDARLACGALQPVFGTSGDLDGHVSIDLDPMLAMDADSTVREAAEVSRLVSRPNLLVKIRVTDQGIQAIRQCIATGIGVHASDILSVRRYEAVLDAYFDGLELAVAAGLQPSMIGMVAALPVGLIDAEFDARLVALGTAAARALVGQGALAIARLAYRVYEERLGTERWRGLSAAGAVPPRLMWTDMTVSDPVGPPTRYVDEFVAWGTASVMSLATLEAVNLGSRLHGDTLTGQHEHAAAVLDEFERLGVSTAAVETQLDMTSLSRQVHVWQKLRAQVASQLKAAGGATR